MAPSAARAELSTVADLVAHLGGIPAARIRIRPAPGTACEADVLNVYEREKRLCELVDGVLVEKPMGFYESYLAGILLHLLNAYLEENDLGVAAGADGMMRLAAGMVRIPDVSFVTWAKLPGKELPAEPIPDLVPDLAVEVLSAGNTPAEMERKRAEYLAAGVRLVWLVDPTTRTATVHTAAESKVLSADDVLDGGDVLTGFSLRVGDIFRRPQKRST